MKKSKEVLELLGKIPKGKVATYGSLAKAARTSPRAVGQIMRRNPYPKKYPCYKVVASSGRIHGYAGCLSGKSPKKKLELLEKDGIVIIGDKIDLLIYEHKFKILIESRNKFEQERISKEKVGEFLMDKLGIG